MFKVST